MRPRPLLALALLAAAPPLRAQADGPVPPQVVPGVRVRVLEAGPEARRLTGKVARADSALLEVVTGRSSRVLAWDRVERIEVSRGDPSFRYAAKGAVAGALLGAAVFKSLADGRNASAEFNALGALVQGAPVGALAGLAAGLALGREEWRTVGGTSVRPFLSPGEGAGVSLRVRRPPGGLVFRPRAGSIAGMSVRAVLP